MIKLNFKSTIVFLLRFLLLGYALVASGCTLSNSVDADNLNVSDQTACALDSKNNFSQLPHDYSCFTSLSDSYIKRIFVDSAGAVWVATNLGLNYSTDKGQTFKSITAKNGLPDLRINDVYSDGSGKVLVATDMGVAISLDGGETFTVKDSTNGLDSNFVYSVEIGANGYFYIGSTSLYVSTDNGATFNQINTDHSVKAIATDSTGYVYLAQSDGLYKHDTSGIEITRLISFVDVNDVAVSSSNRILVATIDGVQHSIDGTSFTQHLIGTSVNTVNFGPSGQWLISSSNGLSMSSDNGASYTTHTTANGLSSNSVNSTVFLNSTDALVGTVSGLNISTDGATTYAASELLSLPKNVSDMTWLGSTLYTISEGYLYTSQNQGKSFNRVFASGLIGGLQKIFTNNLGHIYLTTSSSGYLYSIDGGLTYITINTSNGIYSNSVRAIGFNNSGHIFIVTSTGLNISTDGNQSFTGTALANQGIGGLTSIVINGEFVYVGGHAGLAVSTNGGSSFSIKTAAAYGFVSDVIKGLRMDSTQKLYIITNSGINTTTGNGTTYALISGLPAGTNNDIAISSSGHLFVAKSTGLYYSLDGGITFNSWTHLDGVSDQDVKRLFLKDDDNLYVSTMTGFMIKKFTQ